MDIFHIETASLGTTTRNNGAIIDDQLPQVSFDGGPEFNLNFFDSPDDSNTGYSDPGSVDSTIGVPSSPPPPPTQLATNSTSSSTSQTSFATPSTFPCSIGMFITFNNPKSSLVALQLTGIFDSAQFNPNKSNRIESIASDSCSFTQISGTDFQMNRFDRTHPPFADWMMQFIFCNAASIV